MFSTSARSNSAKVTGFTRRLLITAAAVIGLAPVALAQSSTANGTNPQNFFVLNNPNDPMFNQLLGINSGNVIVGYFGDGNEAPNVGYVLVPANHYSIENFTAVANCIPPRAGFPVTPPCPPQTQATGINSAMGLAGSSLFPDIVGFYIDTAGFTHGFVDSFGVQSTIDDPAGLPPRVTTPTQQLLGINNALRAVGFWTDNAGHENGFIAEINTQTTPVSASFTELPPSIFGANAVATQISGINNNNNSNLVCGFWTDTNDIMHGFEVFFNTTTHSFNVPILLTPNPAQLPNVKSLLPLGCNDSGVIVGSYIANDNNVHGFVLDGMGWHNYDAAGSSQTKAFMNVQGTVINGINDAGNVVGFFSDGTNVNGFVDFAPVP